MRNRRLWWVAGVVLTLALVLAFPLRGVLFRTVIVPLAYLLWTFGLFYRSMPQLVWWVLALVIIMLLVLSSLAPGDRYAARVALKPRPAQGQVQGLAQTIQKTGDGAYFKWLVANRLGKLAYKMLTHREGDMSRSVFAPLVGAGWHPSPLLQKYLETGLHGSFADYPNSKHLQSAAPSPLEFEIDEAVEFLESQLETRRDRYR